jgi:hypothetical protein
MVELLSNRVQTGTFRSTVGFVEPVAKYRLSIAGVSQQQGLGSYCCNT